MRYAFFLACVLLAGCAAIERQPLPAQPIGDAFHLTGRVSVKYGAEAASGSINWRHESGGDDLLISTPLGQGVAHIVRRDRLVSLTTSDQKRYQAGDVETLTRQVLGWSLPLAGLPDWVLGRAAAGAPAEAERDDAQRLTALRQSGWLIEFLAYAGSLPARMRLSRQDVDIKLVIDQWRDAP
jgi:outer membrane lipoprotein LolB